MAIKKNQSKKNIVWLVIGLVLGSILLIFFWLWYLGRYDKVALSPTTFSDFGKKNQYAINPENILSNLGHSEGDLFAPQVASPEKPTFEQPFEWHQSDYLNIATALHEFVWKETLDGWNIYYMYFSAPCRDKPDGFDFGEVAYFKTVSYDAWLKNYVVYAAQITPRNGNVTSAGGATYPKPLFRSWKYLDPAQIAVTAEDALKIAEENGGQEARLSTQNKCNIQVKLSGDFGWRVFVYDDGSGSLLFNIEVDQETGKIK